MFTVGERIRKLRREKDWSQRRLAQKAGIHEKMVCRYEKGVNIPSIESLQKIADALGVTTDFLMAETLDNSPMAGIQDELLWYVKEIEKLDGVQKKALREVLTGMILKNKMKAVEKED